jgi:bacillithiol system protein YtxJ
MSNLIELTTADDWENVKNSSSDKPVFVFKHSTTCPISARAWKEYNSTLDELTEQGIQTAFVKVIESRPVSNQIAQELDVVHQSPQVILIKDQKPVWNTSHGNITKDALLNQIS